MFLPPKVGTRLDSISAVHSLTILESIVKPPQKRFFRILMDFSARHSHQLYKNARRRSCPRQHPHDDDGFKQLAGRRLDFGLGGSERTEEIGGGV